MIRRSRSGAVILHTANPNRLVAPIAIALAAVEPPATLSNGRSEHRSVLDKELLDDEAETEGVVLRLDSDMAPRTAGGGGDGPRKDEGNKRKSLSLTCSSMASMWTSSPLLLPTSIGDDDAASMAMTPEDAVVMDDDDVGARGGADVDSK